MPREYLFDDPQALIEKLVPESLVYLDNIFVLARSLASKYIRESSTLFELIDKLDIAIATEQDMTTKDALAYLALKIEALDAEESGR